MTGDTIMITRRAVIRGAAGLAGACAGLPLILSGTKPSRAGTGEKPGDMAIGAPDAPITVIEYFSLTCPHCRSFHVDTYPQLKTDYVDTGKVRFIARDFPLNRPALHAAMLARCAGEERYFAFIETLFHTFDNWTRSANYVEALSQLAQLGGISDENFRACINDNELEAQILTSMLEAQEEYDVSSTPTFIVNGKKHEGALRMGAFAKVLDRLLPES